MSEILRHALKILAASVDHKPQGVHVSPRAQHHPGLGQASDMDADSLRSRFRVLVPIYLGPIHVLACAWWAVGTWQLPNFWSPSFHLATPSAPASITIASWSGHSVVTAFNATAYNADLLKHWVGWYPGGPTPTVCCSFAFTSSVFLGTIVSGGVGNMPSRFARAGQAHMLSFFR